jgi:MFS family permease
MAIDTVRPFVSLRTIATQSSSSPRYLLSFLDRANIGNARLAGMEEDLNMSGKYEQAKIMSTSDKIKGTQYNMSLTIFFISYALFEPLTNALLKRLTPRLFFTCIILAWGTIMTLMGLVTNYQGLLAGRFMLGIAEAGLFPGECRRDHSALLLSANGHRCYILPFLLVQEL